MPTDLKAMGGHRRDQSDSHMPLRQGEVSASFDAQELQVRIEPNDAIGSNHTTGGADGNVLAFNGLMHQSTSQMSEQYSSPVRSAVPPEVGFSQIKLKNRKHFCKLFSRDFISFP